MKSKGLVNAKVHAVYDLLNTADEEKLEEATSRKRRRYIHPYNKIIERATKKISKK